jgi:transposase InsO family protein
MSAPGQPTENAGAESFFKTVKCEEVYVHKYQTFEEAQVHLQTFLAGCVQCETPSLILRLCASR